MARITCFDGAGCIGGNKILLEDGEARLFFDFGRNFSLEGAYYEEFLQPKPCAGLYEYLRMGLLPPLRDLYRGDLTWGGADPWEGIDTREIGDIGGVLVSHAHLDHLGAVHHLRTDIPIYCSPMTAVISRALQDTGSSSRPQEYCYYVERESDPQQGLKSPNGGTGYARRYHLTAPAGDGLASLWKTTPWARRTLEAADFDTAQDCAGLRIRRFGVDHSVFGASAWAVETEAGWVVYAGDLRLHGGYGYMTRAFAEEAAALEPAALIIEGTRIESSSTTTEADVADACAKAVRECGGLAVADFGPRNVERLLSFKQIAVDTGRKLAILPRDAYLLHAMRLADGEQEVPALDPTWARIYREYSSDRGSVWRALVFDTYQHLVVRPTDVAANQTDFICCLSFFDVNELAYIRPKPGSVWIYSSCEAFDEEMAISAERLQHWLDRFGMQRRGKLRQDEQESDPFHVSGHASGPDLVELVRTIRPKMLVPVHTQHPEAYADQIRDLCEVRIPERGVSIEF